jgi:hypothetical protein
MSATVLKCTKWRFSSLNQQNFVFIGLGPKSPTRTGIICVKTLEPNISSLAPLRAMQSLCSFFLEMKNQCKNHVFIYCENKYKYFSDNRDRI